MTVNARPLQQDPSQVSSDTIWRHTARERTRERREASCEKREREEEEERSNEHRAPSDVCKLNKK